MTQVHRLGLTLDALCQHWPLGQRGPILDLGAFPFTLDIAIREYLGFPNAILATVNQQIPEEWRAILKDFDISPIPTNLDPYVKNTEELTEMRDYVQADPDSVEFVIFSHVVEHLYHPAKLLTEAHRVLRRGGRILLSTDNAFLLHGLINYLTFGEYVHEPVEGTAAMTFTTWRGHVRFFTASDLRTLLIRAGFKIIDTQFHEVLYNSFLPEYFRHPTTGMPRWRADLLTQFPHYRNEIIMVAEKT
jgi:SAM-dependent methyltransferase